MDYRKEKDMLGEKDVPADAYYGIHTMRAVENFPVDCSKVNLRLIRAFAYVKKACAMANEELGYLEAAKSEAIQNACAEVQEGRFDGQFCLSALQGGAGTSTNMNVNEVIANRAIEMLGGRKGDYRLVHPIEDVNMHQSTNDTYPTALKVASLFAFRELSREIAGLQGALQKKEKDFADVIKIGRTELQEAVPVTLGAEFSSFAEVFSRDRWRTFKCEERLRVVNLGGTAVGTGLCAPRSYIFLAAERLREITGLPLSRGDNMMGETASADVFVEASGILKANAANLMKTAGDLRLLHAFGEIRLPALQAGSSLMPGKINPVVCEAVMQAGMKVSANDGTVFDCASRGSLQIVEFLPLLAHAFLESLDILITANRMLAGHVEGVRADAEVCRALLEKSEGLFTAFVPSIGYEKATEIIGEFAKSGKKNIKEFLEEKLGRDLVSKVLSPQSLISLGYRNEKNA